MLPLLNPAPLVLIATMTMGILMHDMHIDKATTLAVMPAAATRAASAQKSGEKLSPEKISASTATVERVIVPNYHTHVERASLPRVATSVFRSSLPKIQQTRDDDRRYIQNKKLLLSGGGDAVSIWPSV